MFKKCAYKIYMNVTLKIFTSESEKWRFNYQTDVRINCKNQSLRKHGRKYIKPCDEKIFANFDLIYKHRDEACWLALF